MESGNSIENKINLKALMTGDVTRLRFVNRFATCPRAYPENVAEHSFYVAFFAMFIAVGLHPMAVSYGIVLTKALMHDVDECYSGDFVRMFKHHSAEVNSAINKTCASFMEKFAWDISEDTAVRSEIYATWRDAKEGVEGKIVSFADFISVLSYIIQEVEGGNERMLVQCRELRKYWGTFNAAEYAFLKPYVEEAGILIGELEERYNGKSSKN